ncbi:peptidase M23 family protein [Streptomyces sp. NBRC 110611]|uniref:M23 family metallopeptidase n=1 Tax=Streptomyces sp. NBRC 110611 TaxID=1621259 RepID=UPI000836CD57|nr:M23 family metallopeptidase [Streptomyces sp. NBRC 110611]GAU68885.1 peptidase M23 family protein [Streptomyces sp. NBRC 110611]
MSKFTAIRNSKKSVLRNRVAVVAAGVGMTAALGAGVASAADSGTEAAKKANAWVVPLDKYTLGSTFGLAGNMWSHSHSGQDFVAPSGTPVKAVHGGTVIKAGLNTDGPAYGNAIVIKHDNGTYSQYAHLSSVQVQVGQNVSTDQKIGLVGSTGNSTGPHLHFEVRTGPNYGTGVEPTGFLRAHGVSV